MHPLSTLVASLALLHEAFSLPTTLPLDYATFQGRSDLLTGTNSYLGMPFAVAKRLENPRLIGPQDRLPGVTDATDYGPACPQHELVASPLYQENAEVGELLGFAEAVLLPNVTRQAEDCLSINVQVPRGVTNTSKLPVLMWIHGGGFELGSSGSLGSEGTASQGVIYQVCLIDLSTGMFPDSTYRAPTSCNAAFRWTSPSFSSLPTIVSTSSAHSHRERSLKPASPTCSSRTKMLPSHGSRNTSASSAGTLPRSQSLAKAPVP